MADSAPPFQINKKALLLQNEPLAPLTSFRIGGPAELLLLPACEEDVRAAIEYSQRNGLSWRVIGSGTNLLIADEGLPGLTIKFWKRFAQIWIEEETITSQAGATMWDVSRKAADAGLTGLEFGCGIPGTVGGAVFMNAGTKEAEVKDLLISAKVLSPDGRIVNWSAERLELGYRSSSLQQNGGVVLEASFALQRGEKQEIVATMNRFLEERRQKQPLNQPNCGSVFRNPENDYAGRLLEEAGCKGLKIGDMQVSELHANFIVNLGEGKASDVLILVEEMRRRVLEKFGVRLGLEMRIFK